MRGLAAAIALLAGWSTGAAAQRTCPPGLATALFPSLIRAGAWKSDPDVQHVLAVRRLRSAQCQDAACVVSADRWTADDRRALAEAADRPSRSEHVSADGESRGAAIGREIDGLNGILDVYAGDRAPLYPVIDGPDDAPGSPARAAQVTEAVRSAFFCQPTTASAVDDSSIGLAAALLTVNERVDAVAFASGRALNGPAAKRARHVDWTKYRFSALVVLGVGPEDPATRLSAAGADNVRLAADRFRRGFAPLIVVTGSAVHPRRTRFVEAVEMRRELIGRYHVLSDAIVLEPRARHTTTNLRNTARELRAIGVPLDKEVLVLTNPDHSRSISDPAFFARNQRELGYQPGAVVARLSPTDLAYRLSTRSLRVDPRDPLDP